jgi:hypothetical protein
MAVNAQKTMYPFAEMFEVTTTGVTAIDLMNIPAGTIIENVMVRIKTAGVGTGNVIVGDDDNDDGFIEGGDATASAGTVYGDDPTERGAYLYDATKKGGFTKLYAAAGKKLKVAVDAATLTTEAVAQVFAWGKRFDV